MSDKVPVDVFCESRHCYSCPLAYKGVSCSDMFYALRSVCSNSLRIRCMCDTIASLCAVLMVIRDRGNGFELPSHEEMAALDKAIDALLVE